VTYPRTLHVGFNPIGSSTNTGLTLASMFHSWPRDDLFELYMMSRQPLQRRGQVLIASPWAAPLDASARKVLGSRIPSPVPDGMNNSIRGRSEGLPLRFRLRSIATTLNEIGPVNARGRWLAPVDVFRPEVIHSLLGGVRITKLVAALADRFDVPVVPHFMDDWLDNLFADGQLLGLPRREVERSVRRVLRRAPLALTIGQDMRQEFERRLALPCEVVGNSVDFGEFARLGRKSRLSEPRTMTYIGGLHLGRDRTLSVLASSLRRLGSEVRLVVHAGQSDAGRVSDLVRQFPEVVQAGQTLVPDQVPKMLVDSDVLVFVESTRPEIFSFTRLSVSTKVPEYLAARRPILVLGPATQSSVRALVADPASRYADPSDGAEIDRAVQQLLASADRDFPSVSPELLEIFDRARTQQRLCDALDRAASAGRPQ
jgi:hypothetical protein